MSVSLETIEAVTKFRFPGAKVQVSWPWDRDCVDIYVLYYHRRGKRQKACYYARNSISGIVMHKYQHMLPQILPVELEHMAFELDERLEKARLVGWKRI